ncbi:nucleotidyltransferase [Oceanirhabdus sp. W0125-5]|uniref:nucleotidyltransferase n=1 Tax=Oceanirhabdus sp. W0125-5 TaxID=2999116 RepID=UPI0022F2D348|nr:nucleotidyltransferase [Oceanirhabdus sp. W0125-5]WBW94797.1 nucleotidyltransferase [Oceanirhabdus sp. W0125-5]
MNITGIITEYNPLHNGHIYHLKKSKELTSSDAIVCVMSGNFVQRGVPAIIDKWERTKFAIDNGIDLLLELPTVYAISSAEFFAYGSVATLNSLGCINNICFGSELGDINTLKTIAKILVEEPMQYKHHLKQHLGTGTSFPTARSFALSQYILNNSLLNISSDHLNTILNSSNNILGIEYCKSLIKLNSSLIPYTIQRKGSSYNETELSNEFASATSIRKFIYQNDELQNLSTFLPRNVFESLIQLKTNDYDYVNPEKAFSYIKYKIIMNPDSLLSLPDIEEGMGNRILDAFIKSNSLEEAINKIKSKRYTFTRIYRLLFQLYLGFDNIPYKKLRTVEPNYIRVLGFNTKGKEILNSIKKNIDIPLIASVTKKHNSILHNDINATNLYSLLNNNVKYGDDFYRKPYIIK